MIHPATVLGSPPAEVGASSLTMGLPPNADFGRDQSVSARQWIGSAEGNAERHVDADTPVKAASRSA